MDNTIGADIAAAALLLLGALIGAKRGLLRSLAGFLTALLAFFGAIFLTSALSPPITELVAQRSVNLMVDGFTSELDSLLAAPEGEEAALWDLFAQYGLSGDSLKGVLSLLLSNVLGETSKARGQIIELFRSAITGGVTAAVGSVVRAVVFLVSHGALLVALNLVSRVLIPALDRLPVLGTADTAGGAALGLLAAAVLLYAALFLASLLFPDELSALTDGTWLLSLFLSCPPSAFLSNGLFGA